MTPSRIPVATLAAALLLAIATPAAAQVAQLSGWTAGNPSNPGSTFSVNSTVTAPPGANRLVVAVAVLEVPPGTFTAPFIATLGGVAMTPLASTDATRREIVSVWYLPAGSSAVAQSATLVVSGSHSENPTGLHFYWAIFGGVDQTTPVSDSAANYAAATTVTFGSQVDYPAGGLTFYAAANGGSPVTETVPAGFTQRIVTTANNQSSFVADTGPQAAAGSFGAATGVAFSGTNASSAIVVAALRPSAADLSLRKTAATASVWLGDTATFTLDVTNEGPTDATNATLTDALPAGLTLVSATPSQGSCTGTATITCALGSLANGASASVTLVATAAALGSLVNAASVAATEPDLNAANNAASASVVVTDQTRVADVSVAKSATGTVTVGGNITYTITVANNGPDLADDVRLSDPLPAGTSLVSVSTTAGTCSGTALVSCRFGAMAPGGTATVTIVASNDSSGTKANVATVSNPSPTEYDPNPLNDLSSATTTVTGGAAPLCVVPGKDGAGGTLSGVVNTYYPGTASVAAGAANTCITVGTPRGAATAISANDLLLVIQMQDATINSTNSVDYGDGPGGSMAAGALTVNAGRYEFVRALGAVGDAGCAASAVGIAGSGANGGLLNTYTNADATAAKGQARFQVVRVPQYTSATLGGVVAAPWTTSTAAPIGLGTGGVLAVDVQGTLGISAGTAASVDGQGFRGAAGRQLPGSAGAAAAYVSLSTVTTHGGKGEGIAGTPRWIYDPSGSHACGGAIGTAPDFYINTQQPSDGYPAGSMARGAPANAGGGSTDGNSGGNDQNSGGGGGSNGGAGGRGGFTWSTVLDYGGYGAAVTPALSQLVLGGGGGAGTRNNDDCGTNGATAAQEGQASAGAAGGGLMVIRAGQVVATAGAVLSANGSNAYSETLNDGGGGGGAGGSVIVGVTSGTLAGLSIQARGGQGGSAWALQAPGTPGELTTGGANNRHGPGGGGGGGVIAYTNTAVPPTLDVAGGSAGITTTANSFFGAQAGGIGQTLFAAPGLVPGAGAGADCTPDLAIALAHQETTVGPGGNATFVATVTNAGPFVASSGLVTVTITLNPGLLPTLASGTGWTCGAPAGQSVTCTRSDALAPQLSYPPITVTATVLASGPATLDNNTATVANALDINAANNTATDEVGVRAPTLAHVRRFAAVRTAAGVRLLWRTSYEVNNLGFRVYREAGGVRTLITPSLVAGSALLAGKQVPLSAGRSYAWLDDAPQQDAVYWLEDVDLDGTHAWTGPATPRAPEDARLAAAGASETRSPLLSGLGHERRARRGRPGPGMGHERRHRHVGAPALLEQRRIAASSAAAKLLVPREGWYRVTLDQLRAAGFEPGDPRGLRLFVDGQEQALAVGREPGADAVEFYGLGIDSPYDGERAYWLVAGGGGSRLRVRGARPLSGLPPAPDSFPFTVERRDRTVTFFSLTTNGDGENVFGDPVTSDGLTLALDAPHLEPTPQWDATLTVALQGVTLGVAHEVEARVNGRSAGTLSFTGQQRAEKQLRVPHEWLREGANELALSATGAGEDVSVVDFVRLTYAHRYALDGGALRFTAPAGTQVTLRELGGAGVRVVDVSDPERPVELVAAPENGGETAAVGIPGRGTATLYAFLPANAAAPDAIAANRPSSWHKAGNQAALVVIAHPSLREALAPLVQRRERQGLATALVSIDDVYDEYSYGQRTPYALRAFLADAATRWRRAPRYVLLAGDASFDPKDYLGFGDFDLVPTKLVPTAYMKTDSDDWLADFDQDGVADLSIGRLPARTPAEAALFVSKILARESALAGGAAAPEWARSVLLVSDEPDEFDFPAASAALRAAIPGGFSVDEVQVAASGAGAGAQIVSAIEAGRLLVNFAGHGSMETWTRHAFFDSGEAAALANGSALPFVVSMTCLNGLFDDVFGESLAETFLKAPGGGAAAVWASSALTEPEPQAAMNLELFRRLFARPGVRLGDAVRAAKAAVTDADVRRTWILFGDPTMTLR